LLATLTIVNATLFDVRDVEQDAARGLRTLPLVLGLKATRAVLGVGATGVLTTIAAIEPRLSRPAWLVLAALLPLVVLLGPRSPRSAYAWLVDGALFLPCLVTLGQ
jgi:4-hydroxybenzoate polyprenyltransferase